MWLSAMANARVATRRRSSQPSARSAQPPVLPFHTETITAAWGLIWIILLRQSGLCIPRPMLPCQWTTRVAAVNSLEASASSPS